MGINYGDFELNVLITSAGRRTTLLKAFIESVHSRGGKVYAGDIDGLAPTLYMADKGFRLPKVVDREYIPFLTDLIKKYSISLIVPTIDTELPVLAQNFEEFEKTGAFPLISDKFLVDCSCDKWKTFQEFTNAGFITPRSWLPEEYNQTNLPDKLFLKPRNGSSSQHTYAVEKSELENKLSEVPLPLIQERIQGKEITIDALLDLDGNPIHYVPRLRIRTIGGESIQGVTISDKGIEEWFEQLLLALKKFGGIGPMTLQAFLPDKGMPIFFEINPRFGGGFPLAYAAGANYPEWILQMLEGKKVKPKLGVYQKGLYMTRYYEEIIVKEPLWQN